MERSARPPEELSPGHYSNIKYWTVKSSPEKFIIAPGSVPWTAIIFVELFVCGLSAVILFITFTHSSHELVILIPMCVIFALTALGCFYLPVMQVRNERNKGDILEYDLNKEILRLPREHLAIRKSQVVEFRILQERPSGRNGVGEFEFSTALPAELRLIYKNPKEKSVTLLRTLGYSFQDVIDGLKQTALAKVVLHRQKSETN